MASGPGEKHSAALSFTLYSSLSARSRPRRSVSQYTGSVRGPWAFPICPLPEPVYWETERRGRDRADKDEYKVKLNLHPQPEGDPGVDHRLPPHDAGEVLRGDVDVRKDLQVRKPSGPGAGLFPGQGGLLQLLTI